MKILIVGNDELTIGSIKVLLDSDFAEFRIVGIAANLNDASLLSKRLHPDLWIIDAHQMDHFNIDEYMSRFHGNLIALLIGMKNKVVRKGMATPNIICLKEPRAGGLRAALRLAEELLQHRKRSDKNLTKLNNVHAGCILLSCTNGIRSIKLHQIVKIKSDKSYSVFHTLSEKPLIASRNLGYFEKVLAKEGFYRVHNSCVVNILHMVLYIPGEHPSVQITDNSREPISRNKRSEVLKILSNLQNK